MALSAFEKSRQAACDRLIADLVSHHLSVYLDTPPIPKARKEKLLSLLQPQGEDEEAGEDDRGEQTDEEEEEEEDRATTEKNFQTAFQFVKGNCHYHSFGVRTPRKRGRHTERRRELLSLSLLCCRPHRVHFISSIEICLVSALKVALQILSVFFLPRFLFTRVRRGICTCLQARTHRSINVYLSLSLSSLFLSRYKSLLACVPEHRPVPPGSS